MHIGGGEASITIVPSAVQKPNTAKFYFEKHE